MSPATKSSPVSTKPPASANINREETPFEALASICSVLVVGLFIACMQPNADLAVRLVAYLLRIQVADGVFYVLEYIDRHLVTSGT